MTPRMAAAFKSRAVRNYVSTIRSQQVPSSVVLAPHEYTDVVELGKEAVPFLVEELTSQDELIRAAALNALSFITNKNFATFVDFRDLNSGRALQLRDKYSDWWRQHKDQPRTEWLIEDLSDADFGTRRNAVHALQDEGDPKAIPALRSSLKDEKLSFYSARALASLGDKAAVPYLIDLYLRHDMLGYRQEGICLLFGLTGQSFDYDPSGLPAARQSAVERWKTWWQKNASEK